MMVTDNVAAFIKGLARRVDATVMRAAVSLVNDRMKTQRVQLTILADEVVDEVEHMQPYGLSFVPPAGSECVALAMGGARDCTVALCVQHPNERPTGKAPRTGGLYTEGQWRVFVDADGVVHLGAEPGASPVALADKVDQELERIWSALTGWTPVPTDGGAAFLAHANLAAPLRKKTAAAKVRAT